MSKGSSVLLAIVMAIAGFAVGHVVGSRSGTEVADTGGTEEAQAADVIVAGDVERYKVPVTDAQPSKGPKDALVTIVEFSEFQCPFCARVLPTTKQVIDTYGDKVRIVWRNNPLSFHNNAAPAAALAMEAYAQGGNDKFWEVHDALFANQKALGRAELEGYAEKAGLDSAKVKKALDESTHKKAIDGDQGLAAQLGARGTPYFFVNGRQLRGAQPFAAFQKVIDEEIATAETLLKQGVKKEQIYATVTKNGLTKAAAPKPAAAKPGQPDPKAVYKVPLKGNEPQKGPNDALITIVEISDFECPFCGRVTPTLNQVQDKYGKDVRIVWMNNPLPFHKNAKGAANAALEAHAQKGNKGFWAMHDKMFANQKALTTENLEKWAKEQGLNVSKFKKALASDKYGKTIQEQQALASSLGARGTPAFFINGRNLRGAQPLAAFTAVIDEEMAKAKALVAKGTPRAKVYESTIAKGETGPKTAPAKPAPDANKVYDIAVPKKAPTKGAAKAKVVIQEFSDFQCPFCSRVNPTIGQVIKEYGDKVQIVWRDYPLPFHKDAQPAAQAAREVFAQKGNKAFWAYHDLLFANQKTLSRENLEKFAEQVGGIDMKAFKAALDSGKHKAAVDADMAAVTKAGARIGTPSFFINGKLIQGAQPFAAFKVAIDDALKN
ncbi:MAG: thioredoxin domain-containing protein [Deltaproteobacteria bacterium]|nr:thioredoxin domain-containing protein [Deltaproteobacteria bacterium]NND27368.1 thioredoxin domain-containing protein [Myxococcales bacterium]MBT8465165.1 thioredoxin domain-containing protein [Deltaproteobacteria bacterium]NNK08331.1 thioredoxin domain-containing protein [Myxococcales bacterium]NNK42150.1 thioredoxin domain-containing protein [Myxococcales bacterium]